MRKEKFKLFDLISIFFLKIIINLYKIKNIILGFIGFMLFMYGQLVNNIYLKFFLMVLGCIILGSICGKTDYYENKGCK